MTSPATIPASNPADLPAAPIRSLALLVAVATITDGATGGAELQARYLAEAWAARGHRVHVVPLQMKRPGGGSERWGDLGVEFLGHDWFTPAGGREFRAILRTVRPDLCYVRVLKPLWRLAAACRREGVPWVYNAYFLPHCEHTWLPPATLSPRALSVYLRKALPDEISKCFLRGAAAVVAQTEEQRAALAANYRLAATVIPNGHPSPAGPFPKASPSLVLWVGKDWKRPAAFVEVAERLQDLDVRFVMVGSVPPELAAAIDARRWRNVARVGTVSPSEVNRLLAEAAAVVSTSPAEGFPNTFIQAWMREAAVLSLSIDPDEVLARDGMGLCSGSVGCLAADLRGLLADEPRRQALVQRAREIAERRHSLAHVAAAYEEVFSRVLAGSVGRSEGARERDGGAPTGGPVPGERGEAR